MGVEGAEVGAEGVEVEGVGVEVEGVAEVGVEEVGAVGVLRHPLLRRLQSRRVRRNNPLRHLQNRRFVQLHSSHLPDHQNHQYRRLGHRQNHFLLLGRQKHTQ